MSWTLSPPTLTASFTAPERPILSDWKLDEARRGIAPRAPDRRAEEETIAVLQETIRSASMMAVKMQRTLAARERRIRELENTLRLLEAELAERRNAGRA